MAAAEQNDHQDEEELAAEQWGAEFDELDSTGQVMLDQIRANEALLRGLKYEYGQALLAFQQRETEQMPDANTLLQIKKIELQIHNDKMYLEARELTRDHR